MDVLHRWSPSCTMNTAYSISTLGNYFFCTMQGESHNFPREPRSAWNAHIYLKGHHNQDLCDTRKPGVYTFCLGHQNQLFSIHCSRKTDFQASARFVTAEICGSRKGRSVPTLKISLLLRSTASSDLSYLERRTLPVLSDCYNLKLDIYFWLWIVFTKFVYNFLKK